MKKNLMLSMMLLTGIFSSVNLNAQEVVKKKGYILTFESNYAELDPKLKQRLISTFFTVYPELAKEYNPKTLKSVKFLVDTAYKGVAATSNGIVTFSSYWMKLHPEDIDVVTHEVMHIVQDYGDSNGGPGWLTEGIADYARSKFGIDNAGAKWSLPALQPKHSYENSYRITARFLTWIEKQKPGTVKALDASLRDHSYTPEIWTKLTGKDLDPLWAEYVKNPAI
jgi:hypothetical protein